MLVNPTMSEKKIVTCYREKESMKPSSPGSSGEAFGEFGDLGNLEHSSLSHNLPVVPILHSSIETILN